MNYYEKFLRKKIPLMFGEIDCIFAGHPCDEDRAIKLLNYAFYNHVSKSTFLNLCKNYLVDTGCCKSHVLQQIKNISKAPFSPYNVTKSKRCWLISNEVGFDVKNLVGIKSISPNSVINIIDSRKSANNIKDYLNFYIASNYFNIHQKLVYQLRKKNVSAPLFASFYKVRGVEFQGLIIFENTHVFIIARLVHNIISKKINKNEVIEFEDRTFSVIQKVEEFIEFC